MKGWFATILSGTLLCFAGAVQAQIPTSTHQRMTTPVPPADRDVERSASWFEDTLRCVSDRAQTRVDNLLEAAPGSEDANRIMGSFQSRLDWCFGGSGSMSFSWDLFRGGLAEVVYHKQFPDGLAGVKFPPAEAMSAWTMPRTDGGGNEQLELVHSAARCLVARRPADVTNLLATEPLSAAEGKVVGSLVRDLGPCLFEGVKFTVSRQSLRGLLAEAMLEYGRAARSDFAGIVVPVGASGSAPATADESRD